MLLTRKNVPALVLSALLCIATAAPSLAQNGAQDRTQDQNAPEHRPDGPPMEHSFHEGHGRWWDNPHLAQSIGLSDSQKKQMDDIFMKHRTQLVALKSTLQKDEGALHPMLQAEQPNRKKVLHQIDGIAEARANLEKANARMLLDIRSVFTPEQWKKLQTIAKEHRREWERRPCESHGPHSPKGPDAQSAPSPQPQP